MKKTVNIASFVWALCVSFMMALFGIILWSTAVIDFGTTLGLAIFITPVIIGSIAFAVLCFTWLISLLPKNRKTTYKPFLGMKTWLNINLGIVALLFMFVELFGISTKSSELYQKQLAQNPPQIVSYSPPPSSSPLPKPKTTQAKPVNNDPWGVAKQIDEHTWTMKVGDDPVMATPREIFDALNNYRAQSGSNRLEWDDRLATYAQTRAVFYTANGLDGHKGFLEYVKNPDNLRALGYWSVGENGSAGFRLNGVHTIEWQYAGDKPHDDNQKDPNWTRVGIGVDGRSTDLIFAR